MFRTITVTSIVAIAASSAAADGLNYGRYSYDYKSYSNDDEDASTGFFQVDLEYEFNNFVLDGKFMNTAFSEDAGDYDFQTTKASAAYRITPEVLAGLGATYITDGDFDTTTYEVFGQYTNEQLGVALNITQNEDDDTFTTLFGEYKVGSIFTLGMILGTSSLDDAGTDYIFLAEYNEGPINARSFYSSNTDAESGLFAVSADYQFSYAYRASASYMTSSGNANEVMSFDIGAGYQITEGAWVDATIGTLDFEGGDTLNTFGIALTFETGERTRLDNRMNQDQVDHLLSTSFGSAGLAGAL